MAPWTHRLTNRAKADNSKCFSVEGAASKILLGPFSTPHAVMRWRDAPRYAEHEAQYQLLCAQENDKSRVINECETAPTHRIRYPVPLSSATFLQVDTRTAFL